MQFKRTYKLTIGSQGGSGNEITDLKIKFTIDKDLTVQTNKSIVEIYNLAPATRAKLEEDDLVCILEAGYNDNIKRIFIGAITYVTNVTNNADVVTRLELSDGQISVRDTIVSLGYGTNVSAEKVIADISSAMGLAYTIADDVEFENYLNGFSFVGLGRDALNKVTDGSNAEWSIQNNVLQIITYGGSTNRQALKFSAESGLIGSPERIIRAKKKPAKKQKKHPKYEKKAGWRIKTLLAPTANPGDLVYVDSLTITGWFTIETMKHEGDNFGSDWVTEMELIYNEQQE